MLQCFKRHPNFLRKESTALSNDSNYKELYQCRNNLFISHGNIIVRFNGTHRFPILIIYTDATPYRLPLVFPLQKELLQQEVEDLSKLSIEAAVEKVRPVIHFYYELRHQNNSGVLCTLEWENLDSGSKFYGVATILQRVRDWCAGHLTGEYPPDSEEVDFCSHFNFINPEIKLFFSESFLNDKLIEGDCYATLYNLIPQGKYYLHTRHLYFGTVIDGVSKSGIIEEIQENLESFRLHEKLKTSADLYKYPDIVNQLIAEKKLLKVVWFHIEKEPQPFQSFSTLVTIIGNGNYDAGLKRLTNRCFEFLKTMPVDFLVGIRFPNRKGILEFQIFKIYKKDSPPEMVFYQDAERRIPIIADSYDKVEAIEGEKITRETFHQRNSKRADYTILKTHTVNVLGTGAIGGEIADCLGKAGIGRICLLDDQTLKAHNAVRHLAGFDHIGEAKVEAVASILYNHNPYVDIRPFPLNLYSLDVSYLEDKSISISSVADDNVEGFVNEQFVIANKTAFYVRALRGGKVGRIFRVIPGKDACFNCLTLYRQEGKEFIDIPEDPEYPTLRNECNNPIRPASAADLKLIASFASELLINFLQNSDDPNNHWIWSSESLNGTPIQNPYQLYTQSLTPHPNCFYCNHDKKHKVYLPEREQQFMQNLIAKNSKIETGGVLAGYIDENGNIIITNASEPGPKAIQSENRFEKDVEYCQKFLDDLYVQSNRQIVYLGEWHSHPSENNHPSGTDIKSLSEIAVQKDYLTDMPAMIIFSNTGVPSCTIHPAGKRYYFTDLRIKND
ncbi:MAG: ThiF family adenylyltransferase [Chitinophagaceae bacterium]|nr:ThiF family adenylyltransferase [Chitinophagaceae bacterium]